MARTRDLIISSVQNARYLRDQQIAQQGDMVLVTRMLTNTTNVYGDRTNETTEPVSLPLIFDWGQYRILLSFSDIHTEDEVELQATARVSDDIPVGSEVAVDMVTAPGDILLPSKIYVITKNTVSHEGPIHSRILHMVPKRSATY